MLLGLASSATAQPFDDPRALVEHVYSSYLADQIPSDYPREQFSPTLRQLWDDMEARSEELEMPILDFDPFINGQDFDITDVSAADPLIEGDTATVVVTFRNFGTPQEMRYSLIRDAGGWKIDDLESLSEEYNYRLSEILTDDPMLN